MSNNSILLIDPNFDPANSANLSLLVKIGADTFSYVIIDQERKFVHAVYDEQECEDGYEKLKERLKNDTYLNLKYETVKIATHTQNVVYVPQELFNENEIALYTKFFADADSQNIYVQPSLQQNIYTVFSLPYSIEKIVNHNWQQSIKLEQNAGLLELAVQFDKETLIIDFTVGSFQFVYIKNNNIAFNQNYQFEDTEELTYFILLIVNQLNINMKQVAVNVCGIINDGDNKWSLLTQYFDKVEILTLVSDLDTTILDDMPAHYYTSLLALQTCG
ncbi:DUF3822 family protein [Pedobacter sp. SL55]|uniref:DUF3822 family protein n=1 Tax=Pedobacter sp. SL55 TaxID=2995161 RepID=UPI00226D7844|nr:DUF3822 family protein [Pedobacter sp. SL55]WAC40089.1 DUF3822 family protein [Pedobacter sp. SL55]